MKTDISVDFQSRLEKKSEKELLVDILLALKDIAYINEERRQAPQTILPFGPPIQSLGTTVQRSFNVPQNYRVEYFIITTDAPVSVNIQLGASRYGPFNLTIGVSYIELPFLINGGSAVQFVDASTGALITGYMVGTYVQS